MKKNKKHPGPHLYETKTEFLLRPPVVAKKIIEECVYEGCTKFRRALYKVLAMEDNNLNLNFDFNFDRGSGLWIANKK